MGAPYQGSAVKVLEHMESFGHKQLSVYTDTAAGLRAFIAIHDTTLGPALGGCRVWPYRTEEEAVTDVLRQISSEMEADDEYGPLILSPLEVLGVDQFADSAVILKARVMTLPVKQWYVGREFNRRIKMRFDEEGIEMPFPHTTLYFGEDKAGNAPPLHLRKDEPEGG